MVKSLFVESVKGGTGKTMVAVNTALRLQRAGKKTGLLDGDIDSPSIADFLKVDNKITITGLDVKAYNPIKVHGVEMFSMGWLAGKRPIYMRGARYAEIVSDAVNYGNWSRDLEFFVVDMPAGLGDEYHTLVSNFGDNMIGSILVTQPSSLDDARRALRVHVLDEIPLIGVVENMSVFKCECGKSYELFGKSGTKELADEFGVEFLGSIPLSEKVQMSMEKGLPFVEGEEFKALDLVAERVMGAEPRKPGFLRRMADKAKGLTKDLLEQAIGMMLTAFNREIPVKEIQESGGYTKGAIIEINLTDEELKRVKWKGAFQLEPGMLVYRRNPPSVDYKLYCYDRAFIWSVLGKAKLDGKEEKYSFYDALLTSKIEYFRLSEKATRGTPDVFALLEMLDGLGSKVGGKLEDVLWRIA